MVVLHVKVKGFNNEKNLKKITMCFLTKSQSEKFPCKVTKKIIVASKELHWRRRKVQKCEGPLLTDCLFLLMFSFLYLRWGGYRPPGPPASGAHAGK